MGLDTKQTLSTSKHAKKYPNNLTIKKETGSKREFYLSLYISSMIFTTAIPSSTGVSTRALPFSTALTF